MVRFDDDIADGNIEAWLVEAAKVAAHLAKREASGTVLVLGAAAA